jgi:hypothetical protein
MFGRTNPPFAPGTGPTDAVNAALLADTFTRQKRTPGMRSFALAAVRDAENVTQLALSWEPCTVYVAVPVNVQISTGGYPETTAGEISTALPVPVPMVPL